MKKRHLALIALCLLLSGCSRNQPETTLPAAEASTAALSITPPAGLYAENSPVEQATNGAVTVYPLELSDSNSMLVMGSDLLIFSGSEAGSTICKVSTTDMRITARYSLSFFLDARDPSVQIFDSTLSYYDRVNGRTVILDASLKEINHIAAPSDLTGVPLLSQDQNTLYYCTASALRGWDLETGIRRIIKETAYEEQSVSGLYLNDTVLQYTVSGSGGSEQKLLVSPEDGRLLFQADWEFTMTSQDREYFASFPTGVIRSFLFGQQGEEPQALTPRDLDAECFFLESQTAAVTVSPVSGSELELDYYELLTGLRRCTLPLETSYSPLSIVGTAEGWVYLLIYDEFYDCYAIYRWDTANGNYLQRKDGGYTGPYYTADNPDYHSLVRCQSYAQQLGERHGVEILIWEDAVAVQPWDYRFQAEYLAPLLWQELEKLDQRLSNYPAEVLEATASHFDSLNICLVRTVTGSPESGSLTAVDGIQFFDGTDAYIVLAVGGTSEKALYHELYHVMETHILGNSIALDQWDKLNPVDFEYDYDYITNAQRDGSPYLQPDTRSFLDTYSMSFPKEDRARIMEYAMTEGNEDLFAASPLQYKLRALCEGIREAYDLEKSPEAYLWEQYLVKPLAYES